MAKMEACHVYDLQDGAYLATVHPASARSVEQVLAADVNDDDGRSQFMWVRLPNGDLILGVYPQGETYFAIEEDASTPPLF